MAVTCRIPLERVSVDSIRTFVTSIQTATLILIFQYLQTHKDAESTREFVKLQISNANM